MFHFLRRIYLNSLPVVLLPSPAGGTVLEKPGGKPLVEKAPRPPLPYKLNVKGPLYIRYSNPSTYFTDELNNYNYFTGVQAFMNV